MDENWTLTWTRLTEISEISVNQIASNTAGVYRFSYLSDDGNYYVFYVGKSEDIKARILEHLSSAENNFCIKNYLDTKRCFFRFAKISIGYIRDATEKSAYRRYVPACNVTVPEGRDDVKVNLT